MVSFVEQKTPLRCAHRPPISLAAGKGDGHTQAEFLCCYIGAGSRRALGAHATMLALSATYVNQPAPFAGRET